MSQDRDRLLGETPPKRRNRGLKQLVRSRLARLFAGTLFAGAVSRLLVLIMTVVLARQLSPEGYGIFTFATGTAFLAAQFSGLGWPALMSRLITVLRIQENWPALRALIRWGDAIVLIGASLAFLLILLAISLPGFDHELQAGLALTLILIFPTSLTLSRRSQLAGARKPVIGIIFDETIPPATVILVTLVSGLTEALPALVTYGLTAAVGALLTTYFFRRALPDETWKAKPQGEPRAWMLMALPLLMGMSSKLVMNRLDILMLGPLASLLEVGYFGAAFRITYLMTFPQIVMMQIITPLLAESIAAGKERQMWRHFRAACAFSLATALPVSIVLSIFSPQVIWIVFGDDFAPSAAPLTLLALSQAASALTIPLAGLLIATGRGARYGLINFVALVVNVALNFILIPQYGAVGAAMASMIAVATMFIWQTATIYLARNDILATAKLIGLDVKQPVGSVDT
jgi:O-antigen/teichoic acid export membrane protein